jgi:hypothetical protein
MGREGDGRSREWMRRDRKSSWEGQKWIFSTREGGRKSEGGKSRDEKIVMVKLIVQKENRNKNKN